MKKYLCIYCQLNNFESEENCFINEQNFVDHLKNSHNLEVTSLETALNSLRTIGMLVEKNDGKSENPTF